ncbi:MAG: peptide-methionine (R)-S-oxide reductase [Verrucomicrobiota bacterium]|jgi:peptide-methionine (R)-S-oxide reductase
MNAVVGLLVVVATVGVLAGCERGGKTAVSMKASDSPAAAPIQKTDAEWRQKLTPEQFRVLRQAGTEQPFGPAYEEFKNQGGGTYVCAACGAELFSSKEKFDSHCGWPSFYDPANAKNVITRVDASLGATRTEVLCAQCGGHLGHVFKGEGFQTPTDQRYCINGVSLKFVPAPGTATPSKPGQP